MFPAASTVTAAVKPVQPVEQLSALRTSQQQAAETARASAGETSAANTRTETVQAVKAAEQSAVAARLRDEEKAEQVDRGLTDKDGPTGPPPTFEESLLERQARLAFEPPEALTPQADNTHQASFDGEEPGVQSHAEWDDPPPTPRERAEVSFAETRTISAPKDRATVDVEL